MSEEVLIALASFTIPSICTLIGIIISHRKTSKDIKGLSDELKEQKEHQAELLNYALWLGESGSHLAQQNAHCLRDKVDPNGRHKEKLDESKKATHSFDKWQTMYAAKQVTK